MMNSFVTIVLLAAGIVVVPVLLINALNELSTDPEMIDEPVTIIIENEPEIIKVIKLPMEDKSILTKVIEFLSRDKTSDKTYGMGPYQCTQFSRDLSSAANESGIPIGGIILGNSPNLETKSNHALNYIIIDKIFYIINPDSDFITPWDHYIHKDRYKYFKLYPDGTLLPSIWYDKLYNVYPTSMLSGQYEM